jgi:serine/threonine protein kinase
MSESDELFARAQGRVGTVLRGKYRLDSVLGVGGMAVVYAATHRNKKRFAVKMLHPELSLRPEIRSRFLREGYAANSVEHRDAVAVLDDDVDDDGVAFLVMELLDGETAEQLCARSGERLPLPVALSIGHQVLDVLASAHGHGVVHRDVKPANLFLTRQGELKLLDFGVARVRDAATSQATMTGSVMGTAGFMAPEQALGKMDDVDALTDVWAVGATVFNLASGRCVHEGDNAQETVVLSATRPAPSLETVVPDAPPAVVQVVDRALAFDKARRWPSALAMRDALRDASLSAFGGLASLPPLPPRSEETLSGVTPLAFDPGGAPTSGPARPPVRWRRRGAVLGACAAALVLGGALMSGRPRSSTDPAPPVIAPAAVLPPSAQPSAATPAASRPDPPAATTPEATASSGKAPAAAPAPAHKAAATASSPATPLRARCVPPFFFDAEGNRVFKKECL